MPAAAQVAVCLDDALEDQSMTAKTFSYYGT